MAENKDLTTQLENRSHLIDSFKARMDKKRTRFEKYADKTTAIAGSNVFLFLNIVWFIIWMVWNIPLISIFKPFDPFPFGLLTSIVSLEAIILAILVLISQNRAAKIADIREEIDMQINLISEEEITKVLKILVMLLEKNNIDISKDEQLKSMLTPTDTTKIEQVISKQLE